MITREGNCEQMGMCCGLAEYDGLNRYYFTAERAVRTIAEAGLFRNSMDDRDGYGFCQVVLTQMIPRGTKGSEGDQNLRDFVAYVKKHKLGSIATTPARTNPNSGNKVKGALFAPSVKGMKDWMIANNIPAMARSRCGWY